MRRWIQLLSCLLLLVLPFSALADERRTDTGTEMDLGETESEREGSPERISYLGPAGTYTEEAAEYYFQESGLMIPEKTVDEAIAALLEGNADYAVIPQENTLGGAVTNYVDALISQPDVYVVGEVILPIRQTLMGIPGASLEDIQTIYSHPQGIKQSEQWRKENLPDAVCQEMDSTAAAASYAAELRDPSVAAIAAPAAAELYGLTVLAQNVQITDSNKTRFYILSMEMPDLEGRTRTAFVADLEASQIDDLMITIHDTGLEVVTIHDRPEGSRLGRYHYLIELEDVGGITKEQIRQLEDLEDLRLFGCFDMIEKAG